MVKDTVVIQISSLGTGESKFESHEIRDSKEAQQLLKDVIENIDAEIGKTPLNQIHHLSPGSVIDVLA